MNSHGLLTVRVQHLDDVVVADQMERADDDEIPPAIPEEALQSLDPLRVAVAHEGGVETGLETLFAQLAPNGRLVAIVTPEPGAGQQVTRFERLAGQAAGAAASQRRSLQGVA